MPGRFTDGFGRIAHQVHHNLLHLVRVGFDGGEHEPELQRNLFWNGRFNRLAHIANRARKLQLLQEVASLAGIGQQLAVEGFADPGKPMQLWHKVCPRKLSPRRFPRWSRRQARRLWETFLRTRA